MNILREKGEPGLTLQQLMQEVEARGYAGRDKARSPTSRTTSCSTALVNKLMKVRPEGSKFKDHWSIRRKGWCGWAARASATSDPAEDEEQAQRHLETPQQLWLW